MEVKNALIETAVREMPEDTTDRDLPDTEWPVQELSISTTDNEKNTKHTSGELLEMSFEKPDNRSEWQVLESEKSICSEEKTIKNQEVKEGALTPPYSNNISPQVKSESSPTRVSNEELVESVETQAEAVKVVNAVEGVEAVEAVEGVEGVEGVEIQVEPMETVEVVEAVETEAKAVETQVEAVKSGSIEVLEPLEPYETHFGASETPSKRIHPEDTLCEKVESVEMTNEQYKFALSILRQLRRNRDARPFNQPVDPIKLNIPSYPTIITHPMDFGTIDKKLSSKQYETVDEFKKDVELVFTNCFTFNGEESPISIMARNLKNIFGKQILQMPSVDYVPTPKPSKVRKKSLSSDTGLGGNPAIHRNSSAITDRPRREIHPPPPRDLPYNETKPHRRKNAAQLQFCRNVIRELQKKTHESYAFPFYRPVDPVALNIPDYYKIVKHPMDMSTIQGKLNNVYNTADEFESDIRQMFRNCYKFNPVGTPVYNMGKRLEAVFDKKWQEKPSEHHSYSSDESDSESDDVDDNEGIALLEKQLAMMSDQLNAMRNKRTSLKTKNKSGKSKKGNSKKSGYRNEERLRILSFDQRSELAQKINLLTGSKLDTVLRIMKESMPELEDQTDEIELDIDSMTPRTQSRLWNFVILNQLPNTPIGPAKAKPIAPKKNRTVLSEAEQLRQIKHLERQLSRFEDKGNGKYISSNSGTEDSSSETESSSAED